MILTKPNKAAYLLYQTWLSTHGWGSLLQKAGLICKHVLMAIMMLLALPLQPAVAASNAGIDDNYEYSTYLPIGFNFQYYETRYQYVMGNRNGFIQFQQLGRSIASSVKTLSHTCLPSDNHNALFVFWDALKITINDQPLGSVLYETQGVEPNRQFVVQWTNMHFEDSELPMGTFQAILYEGTNQIKYQYVNLADERSHGNQAAIGLQGPQWSGQKFIQIGCNEANVVAPGQAILFTPVISDEGEWDYVVDKNAPFEAIELFDLTPYVPNKPDWEYEYYTNHSPQWAWNKHTSISAYEIDVWQGDSWDAISVYSEVLGNVDHFAYATQLSDGQTYTARVRGKTNSGEWTQWSDLSKPTKIDTVKPTTNLTVFLRMDAGIVKVNINSTDDYSGIEHTQVQIATDTDFNNVVEEHVMDRYSYTLNIPDLPRGDLYARVNAVDKAGNESGYTQALALLERPTVNPSYRYSKNNLTWSWVKDTRYNRFEIQALNEAGETVWSETISPRTIATIDYHEHGKTVRARVRGNISPIDKPDIWGGWSDWSPPTTIDSVAPTVSLNSFYRTKPDSVGIKLSASDDVSGIKQVILQISTDAQFAYLTKFVEIPADRTSFEVSELPLNTALYARLRAVDYTGNESVYTPVLQVGIAAPHITTPVTGVIVREPLVSVSGSAEANAHVQLYLNGAPVGARITVDASGEFTGSVVLGAQGSYNITADVRSDLEQSALSDILRITYKLLVPQASFVTPSNNATLGASTDIEVSASDEQGIANVEIYVDDTLLATLNAAPYVAHWNLTQQSNGTHTLKTVVTSTSGKQVSASRTVKVEILPAIPPVPPTAYTGEIGVVSPAMSYGSDPVQITGRAIDRSTAQAVANTPLKLVLSVKGFERQINVVTNSAGEFSYRFVPQVSDSGAYSVFVIHPNETTAQAQGSALGSFTINRMKFDINSYALHAARNIPAQITVKASAIANTQGLRWVALPKNQPSGSLPAGITIEGGIGIDLVAGQSEPTAITFTATDSAAETGMVILTALASDSGNRVRGNLRINYQLSQAQPGLRLNRTYIETGVQQDKSVTETLTLSNGGLVAAEHARVQIQDEHGQAAPAWIFLGSSGELGNVDVGASTELQVIAQPNTSVADGIYRFKLQVSADNDAGGYIPITVSIMQGGIGAVRFDVADIYTATLGADGQPIAGVKGATIKLQNEAVLTATYKLTTDAQGIAFADQLPPGIYIYRISASEHSDVSGRVRIRPGVTINQHIFLDYEVISIEFGVTETTVDDVYDIVLEATFNTQVPAPVVLMEPQSINLADMQVGEVKTGQLTLTNYGLVQADDVDFTLPQSDAQFKFEFFGEIPQDLPPKTRFVIPYRVTALAGIEGRSQGTVDQKTQENSALLETGSADQPVAAMLRSARSNICYSYSSSYKGGYKFKCANGDKSKGNFNGHFYILKGECGGSGGVGGGSSTGGGWSGWGNGYGSNNSTFMGPSCPKDCNDPKCCRTGGTPAGGFNQ